MIPFQPIAMPGKLHFRACSIVPGKLEFVPGFPPGMSTLSGTKKPSKYATFPVPVVHSLIERGELSRLECLGAAADLPIHRIIIR